MADQELLGDFVSWLKALWCETSSKVLFLAGTVSTFIQFFVSGLTAHTLRVLGIVLVVTGFVWANFQLYRRGREDVNNLQAKLTAHNQPFVPAFKIEGTAPSPQYLKVEGNSPFQITRLEYLLADNTMVVGTDFGTDFKCGQAEQARLPISDSALLEIQNMPQPQRNRYDGSCPVRFRISVCSENKTHQFIHPAWIRTKLVGSVCYRLVVG
jgi:hypothetical protein